MHQSDSALFWLNASLGNAQEDVEGAVERTDKDDRDVGRPLVQLQSLAQLPASVLSKLALNVDGFASNCATEPHS